MKTQIFTLLITVLTIVAACKPDDEGVPIVLNLCGERGYELVDGVCTCPEGSFSAYGRCRELRENEWYAITSECPCVDTLFLIRKGFDNDGKRRFSLNEDVFPLNPPELALEYTSLRARLSGNFSLFYFELTDGDSISGGGGLYMPSCDLNEDEPPFEFPWLTGKFTPNEDTLRVKFRYVTLGTNIPLDSCEVIFTR